MHLTVCLLILVWCCRLDMEFNSQDCMCLNLFRLLFWKSSPQTLRVKYFESVIIMIMLCHIEPTVCVRACECVVYMAYLYGFT